MNYAYLRVSTDLQDAKNQKHGLLEYCNSRGFSEVKFISEQVSGRHLWKDR